jgi:hypothetical protein
MAANDNEAKSVEKLRADEVAEIKVLRDEFESYRNAHP